MVLGSHFPLGDQASSGVLIDFGFRKFTVQHIPAHRKINIVFPPFGRADLVRVQPVGILTNSIEASVQLSQPKVELILLLFGLGLARQAGVKELVQGVLQHHPSSRLDSEGGEGIVQSRFNALSHA